MDCWVARRIRPRRREATACITGIMLLVLAVAALGVTTSGCTDPVTDAVELEQQGDLEGALAVYETVLEEKPDDVEALSGAAVCLLLLGRHDEALGLQERVISLDKEDAQTRIELGFNYLNHQGRPEDAVRVLSEAASLESSARNLSFLAQAQVESGDSAGAERTLRQAVEIEPDYAYSYDLLVKLLKYQGRTEEAAQVTQEAFARGITIGSAQ